MPPNIIPSIKVREIAGDIHISFEGTQFKRPELFDKWAGPLIKNITAQFIGQKSNRMFIAQIEMTIERELTMAIVRGDLWFDHLFGKWDFNHAEDPNEILKELI